MRALIQRVRRASVTVEGEEISAIQGGLLILLGVEASDTESDIKWLARKVCNLRVFDNDKGVMDKSLLDTGGECLIVSQFTLYADCRKGNRPSWSRAAGAVFAEQYYEKFTREVKNLGVSIKTGKFQAHMKLDLVNDGPVTIMLDTKE